MSIRHSSGVRVLVLCASPDSTGSDPESVFSILEDLGCRLHTARFDLGDLDAREITSLEPSFVVLDAGDDLNLALQGRKALLTDPALAEVPTLLVVSVARLAGLDFSLGFDDFLLSPVVPAELYARLRQLDWRSANFGSEEVIKLGDLVIDLAGYEVRISGRSVEMTHQEFELLRFLAQNRGRVYSREQLLQNLWGFDYSGGTRTVDIHIRRLRAKLGPMLGALIVTIRNVGYKMRQA